MAAVIAKAHTERVKTISRLGNQIATVEANTWNTFAKIVMRKDGSGYVEIKRDGKKIHQFDFGAE